MPSAPTALIIKLNDVPCGTEVGAGAQIQGPTKIGRENRIYPQAAIGFDPQDLKFQGEEVRLEIGDRNPGDTVIYPDDDIGRALTPNGERVFVHRDGRPY